MARLQRLLWSEEYNFDDVILIEGEFIQILDSGDALRYVILGLTPKLLLIAEDNMDQSKDIDPGDLPTDDDYDLEDLELAHLYPLSVVKLTVRHSKEHELKMRMMNGETQFFEFADNVDREEKWHHWVARIHEVHVDYLGDPGKAGHILHTNEGSHHSIVHVSADVFKPKERGRSPAFKWMKHFTMTVSETHNDDIEDEVSEVFTLGLPILHEVGRSSMSVRRSVRSRSAMMNEDKNDDSSVQSSDSGQTEGSDEVSEVEDSGEEEKDETLKSQRLRRLVLSVGEFFGVANAEPHIHGPFVLRRTASLTALQEIKRAEESQIKTLAKNDPFNINREKITHTTSRPDILEGEATFIEDVPHLAKMTHRASLLSAELENDDPSVTPYYVNGHVMLLTNEEVALEKEVEQARQQHVDLSFSTVRKKGKYRRIMERKIKLPTIQTTDEFGHVTIQLPGEVSLKKDDENKPTSKKRFGSKLFKGKATKAFRNIGKKKDKSKPSKNTKLDKKKRSTPDDNGMSAAQENAVEEHGPIIKHVDEIDSDSLAKELTLIDRDLLIRVRDTELIDCKWTKKDKHYSAPNIMELIEFFERLVNLVATEILAHESLVERTQTLAKFIDVAVKCYHLQNFNSLRSVMAGLQVTPIYRLHDTWNYLKNMYKQQYKTFLELSHLMSDERNFACYHEAVDEAMKSPPCMPFFGIFLRSLIATESVNLVSMNTRKMKLDIENEDGDKDAEVGEAARVDVEGACKDAAKGDRKTVFKGIKSKVANIFSKGGSTAPTTSNQEVKTEKVDVFSMLAVALSARRQQRGLSVDHSDTSSNLSEDTGEGDADVGKDGKPKLISRARRRRIRRAILQHARKIRAEKLRELTDELTEDGIGPSLFATMASLVSKEEKRKRIEERKRKEREKERHKEMAKMLFHYQINAIKYRFHSKANIRSFLLRSKCNTGRENYKLSCLRESPHQGEIKQQV